MAKILIVEDNEGFREILKTTIAQSGHETEGAEDGKSAQYILGVKDFDIVLSDVKMPNMDGIELLKWIKANKNTPVILMTGFSEVLQTHEAAELGADGFLPKPFSQDDLDDAIANCTSEPQETQNPDGQDDEGQTEEIYCKVGIEDFISGKEIPFSIYLKIGENRFIKIAYKGEDISLDRIKAYKSKDINFLYLKKEDFAAYVGLTMKITRALAVTNTISQDKKNHFLRHAGEVILEKVHLEGVDSNNFKESSDFLNTTLSIVSDNDNLYNLLSTLNDHADHLYAHSLGVSLYGVMVAREVGWTSAPTIFKVSMGGLFHDIGKKEIDRDIIDKSRVQMSQTERSEFETHPRRGMELLSAIEGVPQEVIQITYQHHENNAGLGYPRNLKKEKISALSRLIYVVNVFCEYAIAGPNGAGMSAADAINQVKQFRQDGIDQEFFTALEKVFNYSPAG